MSELLAAVASVIVLAAAPAPVPVEDEPRPEPFVLRMPAFGQVTSEFGPRWGRMHQGIDVGILEKLPVVAAADGEVTHTGWIPGYEGYGLVVLIDHGRGFETLYAHLSRVRAKAGQRVEAGTWLGMAGCTGSCTGTHLHFELREHGVPIDPMRFFSG